MVGTPLPTIQSQGNVPLSIDRTTGSCLPPSKSLTTAIHGIPVPILTQVHRRHQKNLPSLTSCMFLHVCHFLLRVLSDWFLNLHFSCGVKRVYQNPSYNHAENSPFWPPSSLEPTLLSRHASHLYLCRSLCSFSASSAVQTASSFSRSPSITCSAGCSICFRSLWAFSNSLTWRISSCSSSAGSSTFGSWCGLC